MSRIAYVNGRYRPHREARIEVEDRGYQFADGVYEVCEVREARLVDERRHMARLARSLAELRIGLPMPLPALSVVLHETVRRNRVRNGIVYLQITRGVARRDFAFPAPATAPSHYIRQMRDTDLVAAIERLLPHIANGAELAAKFTSDLKAKFVAAMPGLKERAKNLMELIDSAQFLYAERPIAIDQKAKPLLGPQACAIIAELLPDLSKVEPWTAEAIESVVRAFVERKDLKLGAVAQPLRAALTGRVTPPGIFDLLQVLGKPESLARLADQASDAA